MPVVKPEALIDNRVEAIACYHAETGVDRAQLDISGGIDSAVMAGLLVSSLGPERVTLCHTIIHTDPRQTRQELNVVDDDVERRVARRRPRRFGPYRPGSRRVKHRDQGTQNRGGDLDG